VLLSNAPLIRPLLDFSFERGHIRKSGAVVIMVDETFKQVAWSVLGNI
jgi:hypothetical protein